MIPSKQADPSRFNREWRELGIWWAMLDAAGYRKPPSSKLINVPLRATVKETLAARAGMPNTVRIVDNKGRQQISDQQPLAALQWIYREVSDLYNPNNPDPNMFPTTGSPYFSKGAQSMLRIIAGGTGISGTTYFRTFAVYHDIQGSDVFNDIVQHLEAGKSVFVDYSNAPEAVAQNLSERIAKSVFNRMVERFSTGTLGDYYIIMYFEEAHQLFRSEADRK